MKILQVNNVYGEKSTGKLTRALHLGLREAGVEAVAVYGRGGDFRDAGVIRLCPEWYGRFNALLCRITGIPHGWCLLSTARLKHIIRREKPDVVHLQCINGNFVNIYGLIRWLKRKRIKTVSSQHAEFMYTANCGYAFDCDRWKTGCGHCPDPKKATKSLFWDGTGRSWKRMYRAFLGFERDCMICPVSGWTEQRVKQSEILKGFPCRTVFNGVDTEVFHYLPVESREPGPVVLHVTAEFSLKPEHIKGGIWIAELARRMPDVTFRVVGPGEGENLPGNLELLGRMNDQRQLAEQYCGADLTVLVSKKETFSMPCAESLCCGAPVVGFRAGAPEQISLPEYSSFVDYGDLDALEAQLRHWLKTGDNREQIADRARQVYSQQTMIEEFMEVYRQCL